MVVMVMVVMVMVAMVMVVMVVISVSNGSRQRASSPGLNLKNRSVRFQTRPKARPADSWWAKPDPHPSTHLFCRVWLDPLVPISSSAFQVSHLWSHSDMLLLIIKD